MFCIITEVSGPLDLHPMAWLCLDTVDDVLHVLDALDRLEMLDRLDVLQQLVRLDDAPDDAATSQQSSTNLNRK